MIPPKTRLLSLVLILVASPSLPQSSSQLCTDDFWTSSTQAQITQAIATEDANATCDLQMSPLHKAARFGTAADIAALTARGAYVDAVTLTVGPPLHVAAYGQNVETIAALISAGANVNGQLAPNKSSPLHLAVDWGGTVEHITALLEAGANMELKDADGLTPLEAAIVLGYSEKADILRAAGAITGQ